MEQYNKALAHLREKNKGYERFTALQEAAFTNADTYDYSRNLFVIGETSSGKTLIPLLIYSMALREAQEQGKPWPKLLFVVPYRALSAQKVTEIREFLQQDNENMTIVQSTAEFRQDDAAIQRGEVDCAIIITEKAFKYESRSPGFLAKYDYIVLDEVGILQNADRGVRLDFLFAWSVAQKRATGHPRLIALGTPFFDWSAYMDSYDFTEIRAGDRPVDLKKVVVTYDNGANGRRIEAVDGACDFIQPMVAFDRTRLNTCLEREPMYGSPCVHIPEGEYCSYLLPCRQDPGEKCPVTKKPCGLPLEITEGNVNIYQRLVLNICREHLKKDHQILIFINDRTRVVQLAAMIYRELKEFFPCDKTDEACKKLILEDCGLEDDDVFGILETVGGEVDLQSFYRTFISGVGFHSAALPHELRSYVERHFLDKREMKVVCSTETLAFGINSAVDVVIVADLRKLDSGDVRPLMLNEYQNYAGRAGRLRKGEDRSQLVGYVYTLVAKKQKAMWEAMQEQALMPEKLYSLLHGEQNDFMPFFLLNLIPTTETGGITVEQLTDTARILPHDDDSPEKALSVQIRDAVRYLVDNGLLGKTVFRAMGRGARDGGERYSLTEQGKNLRGLIIGKEDFEILTEALEVCVPDLSTEPDRERFLYSLLSTKHAESGLNSFFEKSETRMDAREAAAYIRDIIEADGRDGSWVTTLPEKRRFVLAAMLAWCGGESPKNLLRRFGIHYALLNRVAEKVAYLIEVAQALLTRRIETLWERGTATITGAGGVDYFLRAKERREEIFSNWFISAFYGLNTEVLLALQAYLQAQEGEDARALAEELSLHHVNPQTARFMRRLVIRYLFFAHPPVPDENDIEQRNNFRDQYNRYVGDIKENLGHTGAGAPHIYGFFKSEFPGVFS